MALLRESCTKGKEGTSAVLTMSMTMTHSVADNLESFFYLRNVQDLLEDGKLPNERRFGEPFG